MTEIKHMYGSFGTVANVTRVQRLVIQVAL
jgi:hypothetical protein